MTNHSEYDPRQDLVSTAQAFGVTDVGCVRDHNEDALRVDADAGLYIVADGMGGHAAGEVASAMVLETVPECARRGLSLVEALCETHRAIQRAAHEGRGAPGMGSTAVVLRVSGADYEIAWVGDSRAYLWDGRSLRQMTRDHSFVQKLLEAQAITADEIGQHPERNVITQALGMSEYDQVRPDTVSGRLYRGEQFLLCSDGLSGEVDEGEIARVLAAHDGNEAQARALVDSARHAGGADNITVLLVRAPEDAPPRPATTEPFDAARLASVLESHARRRWWIPGLAVGAGVLLALGATWLALPWNGPKTTATDGATAVQAPRVASPAVSEPPLDVPFNSLRAGEAAKREPDKIQPTVKQGAPQGPAKIVTVPALKPQQADEGEESRISGKIEKGARSGDDRSGQGSKRKD